MGPTIAIPWHIVRIPLARTRVRAWMDTEAMDGVVKVRVYSVVSQHHFSCI